MTKPILAMVALAALSIGCESRENETTYVTPTPTPAPAPVAPKTEMPPTEAPIGGGPAVKTEDNGPVTVSIEGAALRMAEAHCQSAMNCKEIGKGKKAGEWSKCIEDGTTTSTKGLTYESCPKGVDAMKLSNCLDTIHSGVCTDIMSSVSTATQCSNDSLCAK
jgi:hypothetical protein